VGEARQGTGIGGAGIDVEDEVEFSKGRFFEGFQPEGAGVVDQGIDSSESRDGLIHHLRNLVFVADIP
jgi:hypothetical protein